MICLYVLDQLAHFYFLPWSANAKILFILIVPTNCRRNVYELLCYADTTPKDDV